MSLWVVQRNANVMAATKDKRLLKTDYYEDSVPMYYGVAMPRTMFLFIHWLFKTKSIKKRNPGILKEYGQRMLEW